MNNFITAKTNETLKAKYSKHQFCYENTVEVENQTGQGSIHDSEVSVEGSEENEEVNPEGGALKVINPEVISAQTANKNNNQAVSKDAKVEDQTEQAVQTNSAIQEENNHVESEDANPKKDLPTEQKQNNEENAAEDHVEVEEPASGTPKMPLADRVEKSALSKLKKTTANALVCFKFSLVIFNFLNADVFV